MGASTHQELADHALACLRQMTGAPTPADASIRIEVLAEIFQGALDGDQDMRDAKASIDRAASLLRDARKAASDAALALSSAHGAITALGETAFVWLCGGNDPEQALSSDDHDRLLLCLQQLAASFDLAAAQADPERGEGFLRSIMATRGRPVARAHAQLVHACAAYLEGLGLSHFVKKSEDGPFHQFVEAIAQLAGGDSVPKPHVSKRQLHNAVEEFTDRPLFGRGDEEPS